MHKRFLILTSLLISFGCASSPIRPPFSTPLGAEEISTHLKWEEISVEGISEANQAINSRLSSIDELIAPNIDPYKGVDSVPEICRKENLPKNFRRAEPSQTTAFVSFYSSNNMVLGLCADPTRLLKTQYLLLYCGGDKLFVVKYFYPREAEWRREPVASCPAKASNRS